MAWDVATGPVGSRSRPATAPAIRAAGSLPRRPPPGRRPGPDDPGPRRERRPGPAAADRRRGDRRCDRRRARRRPAARGPARGRGEVRRWDPSTGAAIGRPIRHGDALVAACFGDDGRHVLTVGRDRRARLWRAADGEPAGPPLPDLAPGDGRGDRARRGGGADGQRRRRPPPRRPDRAAETAPAPARRADRRGRRGLRGRSAAGSWSPATTGSSGSGPSPSRRRPSGPPGRSRPTAARSPSSAGWRWCSRGCRSRPTARRRRPGRTRSGRPGSGSAAGPPSSGPPEAD